MCTLACVCVCVCVEHCTGVCADSQGRARPVERGMLLESRAHVLGRTRIREGRRE